jgi:hypothetical protein
VKFGQVLAELKSFADARDVCIQSNNHQFVQNCMFGVYGYYFWTEEYLANPSVSILPGKPYPDCDEEKFAAPCIVARHKIASQVYRRSLPVCPQSDLGILKGCAWASGFFDWTEQAAGCKPFIDNTEIYSFCLKGFEQTHPRKRNIAFRWP